MVERENPIADQNNNFSLSSETPLHQHRTIEFIKAAIAEGAHKKKPLRTKERAWIRQRNAVGIYYGSPAVLEDIRELVKTNPKNISRERARQICVTGIKNLWRNCSHQIQQAFPFSEIICPKPLSQTVRERRSLKRGGKSLRIATLVREGMTVEEIKEVTGFSGLELANRRSTLKSWGIELSCLQTSTIENRRLTEELRRETDDRKIQELLSRVKKSLYTRHSQGENPLFIPVTRIVSATGFYRWHRNIEPFVTSLKKAGVPVGEIKLSVKSRGRPVTQRYIFVVARHKERATKALLEDESLRPFLENPVVQVCGPESEIPSTYQFLKGDGYKPTSQLFYQLGINLKGRSKLKAADFFTPDCPVPIFKYGHKNGHCYPTDQENELRDFLKKRKEELKIRPKF